MERIEIAGINVYYDITEKANDFQNEAQYRKSLEDFLYKRTYQAVLEYCLPSKTPLKIAMLNRQKKSDEWHVRIMENKEETISFSFECNKGRDFISTLIAEINSREFPKDEGPDARMSMGGE